MNSTNYVRNTVDLVKQIETRFFELGSRLHRIRDQKLWEADYESFYEFLDAAHINPSMASRLMKIHEVYVLAGKQDVKELAGIGYSNLYESIPLIERDGVEATVVRASTLSRSEIIDEVKENKYGDHVHQPKDDVRFALCSCGKFIRTDA